jgi:hypothetical protein
MAHRDKTMQPHFTPEQRAACGLRQRIAHGLVAGPDAVAPLAAILYGPDYTASTLAAELLGRTGAEEAVVPLVETVLFGDGAEPFWNRRMRLAALASLAALESDDEMVVAAFAAARHDSDAEVAAAAAALLPPRRLAS